MSGRNVSMPEPDRSRFRFDLSLADRVFCGLAIALFTLAAIRFLVGMFGAWLTSDAAVPALLADEILRKASLFPRTWYYGNGEIWTLAPQILALPFVAVLGLSTLSLKLANATALVLAVASVALLVRHIVRSSAFALIVAVGVLAPFSAHHIAVVYEQAAYGWVLAQLALLTWLSLRILDRAAGRAVPAWIWIAYAALLVQFTAGSPLRTFVYWMIPLVIASVVTLRLWQRRDVARLVAVSIALLLAGAALHEVMRLYLQVFAGVGTPDLHRIEDWPAAVRELWRYVPSFADYGKPQPFWNDPIHAVSRWVRAIFLVLALAASVLTAWPSDDDSPGSVFFAALSAAMFVAVLGAVVVVDLPNARYLFPPLLLCLVALMTKLRMKLRARALACSVATGVFVLAFCGGALLQAPPLARATGDATCEAPARICHFAAALEQHGLHKGYATYWEANVTTLASNGDIKVCGILTGARIKPFRWLVSEDCFDPPTANDRYFVAFLRAEAVHIDRDAYIADLGRPDLIAEIPDYEIWIYEPGTHRTDWLRR
jgi:hypothetical protein